MKNLKSNFRTHLSFLIIILINFLFLRGKVFDPYEYMNEWEKLPLNETIVHDNEELL